MATSQFEAIYRGTGPVQGKLRIAPSGLGWKPVDGSGVDATVITVPREEIKFAQWIRVARHFQIRIGTNKDRPDKKLGDRRRETFEGFQVEDHDKLANLFKQHYNIQLENKDTSLRGWNWGKVDVQASDLAFLVAGKPAFELPLANVINSSISKTEVALEFLDPSSGSPPEQAVGPATTAARRGQLDQLVEVRFYVPGAASKSDAEDDAASDLDGDGTSAAQMLHDLVKEKADIGRVAGEGIVTFPEVLCTTPRGRYDIDMYANFLRLRGKTYEYKVLFSSIQRLFLLPKPDDIHFNFVVQLEPPIRQGQTRYPFLVMQFARDEEMDAELNLNEEELEQQFNQKHNKIEGPAHEVVSIVFKGLAKKRIVFPQSFQSVSGQTAIKCNMKANEGLLYFLEKYVLFISKQPILIPISDIHSAKFARVGGALQSSRTFDLVINKKDETELQFSSLSREEHPVIEEYLKNKNKKVQNEMVEEISATGAAVAALLEDEDEDEEMREASDAGKVAGDDDDESEDESFAGGSSGSDVAEEYDSNYGGSDSESDDVDQESSDERPTKKRKAS